MKTTVSKFGTYQGQDIALYSIKNNNGVEIKISNFGATVTTVNVPNDKGEIENLACGFDQFENYFSKSYTDNAPYFGGTVGRYCSQIKNSKFTLNGKEYPLAANCGDNNLHGGVVGFDKKVWDVKIIDTDLVSGVAMSLVSKDLEEGFPGNVTVTVTFTLNDQNEFAINYVATPDQDTPLALTNHTYFNLNGFSTSIEGHSVKINASNKLAMDETGAALGAVVNLNGENDDLRTSKIIKNVHTAMNDGFEHYYIFDKENFQLEKVAEISSNITSRKLEVSTSEPGMLFYTGKYTSDEIQRENGQQFGKYRGFCCETHRFPNGPNIENSPKSITKAGEEFKSTTIFKFSW
ncbi:aldose epimerase family protein [Wenyingzhuangia aestuarii]|uniref:aldose epimerase family protein n=1 Tax=Wenyingzhuangia aestuarii TaxID=1647582 RepID=UPI001439E34F|nr:aldose epimerase family protein [Wenyingzhuangia aestuarii]NJB82976.1 aldose 1-epimerase [Wenyingzhuangia aestuarii]